MILHRDAEQAIKRMQDKSHILKFLRKLEKYPATPGDYFQLTPKGNPIQLKALKRHILIYTRDPFAEETRILDLVHTEKTTSQPQPDKPTATRILTEKP